MGICKREKKGQLVLEYIALVGMIIIIVVPVLYIAGKGISENYRVTQAEDVVRSVAITADAVRALGHGSEQTVSIKIPPGVEQVSVGGPSGNEIVVKVDGKELVATSGGKLWGNIPSEPGTYEIPITQIRQGIVKVGDLAVLFPPQPANVLFSNLPINVSIFGYDIQTGFTLLFDGNPYPSNLYWNLGGGGTYIGSTWIVFEANASVLGPGTYNITVENPNGVLSNGVIFTIT